MRPRLRRLKAELRARAHFLLGFDNIAGLRGNLMYAAYHRLCRYAYGRGKPAAADTAAIAEFRRDARLVLPPSGAVLTELETLPAEVIERLDDPASKTKFEFLSRYFLGSEDFERIRGLLSGQVDALVRQALGSHYAVTSAYVYRTVPSNDTPRSTFLWHVDDHPDCHLKLFFYLNDTYRTNGALQAHDWASSRDLKRRGFRDRRDVPPAIEKDMNDPQRYTVVEGKRGTAIIFSANTLHRAVIPETGRRDMLAFDIVPSPDPVLRYLNRHFLFWENPLDLLFPPGQTQKVAAYD